MAHRVYPEMQDVLTVA